MVMLSRDCRGRGGGWVAVRCRKWGGVGGGGEEEVRGNEGDGG